MPSPITHNTRDSHPPTDEGWEEIVAEGWVVNDRGATTLEWALLLAAIALPSYFILKLALETLTAHYQMMTTLNNLPFP
ncbi:MAG: hypothetical protein GC164_10710 [Phycisphaera sp.]|nr:hypothetical protein [Phycisphaera sp.]